MSNDVLDDVRTLVVDDPALRDRLLSVPNERSFVAELIELARERGIELSAQAIESGLREARRRRLERWV
jgi:post-segregation antitoxin (ccd killing protein)